jgi:hypothetical protein
MTAYSQLAEREDLLLLGAESGQSIRGIKGVENKQALVNLFSQAKRDPRMGELYKQYFAKWQELGGDAIAPIINFPILGL